VLKKNQNLVLKKKEESKKINKKNQINSISIFKVKFIRVFFKFSKCFIDV
jgi:hypothetical protein